MILFKSLIRDKTPIERWSIANETEHFVHLQLNANDMPMQVFEELRNMGMRVITCGANKARDYKFDFYCERMSK